MRISIFFMLLLTPLALAQNPDPMDYYGLARSLAIRQGKHLSVIVDASQDQGVVEGVGSDTIGVRLHCFEGCSQGDIVIARNRGTWLEWVSTLDKNGNAKFLRPTVKQSWTVPYSAQDCPTGS